MNKKLGVLCVCFVLLLFITACNLDQNQEKADVAFEDITRDKLFITDGYQQKLSSLGLIEVAALPYFHSPFIVIAKDNSEVEYAVIFDELGESKRVKLPVTYEEIYNLIGKKGFMINGSKSLSNLHLFDINQKLYWNYEDGNSVIYLSLEGKVVVDPYI